MRVSLLSRIFTDSSVASQITAFNFKRSIVGKINIDSLTSECKHNCNLSLLSKVRIENQALQLSTNTMRACRLVINVSEDIQLLALRRRNLPLPPQGQLTLLRSDSEEKLKGNSIRRGDTHIIQATIIGDFQSEPKIIFVAREQVDGKVLFLKSNANTQGDISITDITPATTSLGECQKLTALVIIHPSDTSSLDRKIIFYTLEIVDALSDEVYTIETDRLTIEPDIYNYFEKK